MPKVIIKIYDNIYWQIGRLLYHFPSLRDYLPDKMYLQHLFARSMGYRMDFRNPKTFNEKLQWLKLYDRNPLYTRLVDKVAVKEYIKEKVGEQYVIPTLGVYSSFDEIDFSKLPNQFVMKCSHDSGSVVICKDKQRFDYAEARDKLERGLKRDWFLLGREWPYKNVKPRIIIEKYLFCKESEDLLDYKFFCFSGEPKVMYISNDHSKDPRTDFFDMSFNHLPIRMRDKNADILPQKPRQFESMIEVAKILSAEIPHVRIDFYVVEDKLLLGEMTFFHNCGFTSITPFEWGKRMGDWIMLPCK